MKNKIINNIFIKPGYSYLNDLDDLEKNIILNDILDKINNIYSNLGINKISCITEYTKDSNKIHHLLTKEERLFNKDMIKKIKTFKFFENLKEFFPDIEITNEENFYPEEIYWRITRPFHETDVGPLHTDSWFWNLGIGKIKNDKVRLKIWILIKSGLKNSGLSFYPNSHLFEFNYRANKVGNKNKPIFSDILENFNMKTVKNKEGTVFLFNDRLIHGGLPANKSVRVSFEFTFTTSRSSIVEIIKS